MSRELEVKVVLSVSLAVPVLITAYKYLVPYISEKLTKPTRDQKDYGKVTPLYITPEDVKTYNDRPWRPFRWPHKQTMALVKMDMNHWLDITLHYWKFQKGKTEIFENYDPEKLKTNTFLRTVEGFDNEYNELRDVVIEQLTARYPLLFKRKGKLVYNNLMNEVYDIEKEPPLIIISKMAMEDFYIVQKKADGLNYCIGATVAFPGGGFGILQLMDKPLDFIHKTVPYYEDKLKPSMEKWFGKFVDGVERVSWHIVWEENLNCSELYPVSREMTHEEAEKYVMTIPFEEFRVRMECQSLTKLPKTKAIIFANHPKFIKLTELEYEPYMPSFVMNMMYECPEEIMKQKHFELVREHLRPRLQRMIDNQIANGLIESDSLTNLRTPPTYPFAHWMSTDWDYHKGWTSPYKNMVTSSL